MKVEELKAMPVKMFAEYFGKNSAWVRRMIHANKIKVIKGYGEWLIPSAEIDRILDSAAQNLSSTKEGLI